MIAISRATADDLVRLLAIPERSISVVVDGIDLARFSPAPGARDGDLRAELALGDRPFLLFVGGADWRKNAAGMFDVLAALGTRAGFDAPLLAWAGRLDEQERPRLMAMAAERGVADRLRLLGWVPDATLAALFRGASALLFLSRAEGFGYPMVEAMASGCPVVCGRSAAALEIGGDAAIAVDLDRTDAIADAVSLLLRDDAERRRCAGRGLARSRAAGETLDVYRRVIAGRS